MSKRYTYQTNHKELKKQFDGWSLEIVWTDGAFATCKGFCGGSTKYFQWVHVDRLIPVRG